MSPFSRLAEQIDTFEKWKDIVSDGNLANLENMTFLEFMAKLDRSIKEAEKRAKDAQTQLDKIKRHGR